MDRLPHGIASVLWEHREGRVQMLYILCQLLRNNKSPGAGAGQAKGIIIPESTDSRVVVERIQYPAEVESSTLERHEGLQDPEHGRADADELKRTGVCPFRFSWGEITLSTSIGHNRRQSQWGDEQQPDQDDNTYESASSCDKGSCEYEDIVRYQR